MAELNDREKFILNHWCRWGETGYGAFITKTGRSWYVQNCPAAFKTKKAAVAQWELYISLLLDKKAGRI